MKPKSRHNRWIFTVLIGAAVGLSWAAWRAPAAHADEGGGRLLGVRAALRGGWLRVVFDFSKPVSYRVRVRPWGVQVGRLTLEFSGVSKLDVPNRIALAGRDGVILKLERAKGSRVLARLPLPRTEGPYDHFTLKNPDRVVLDLAIRPVATAKVPDFRTGPILMSPYRLVQRPGPKGRAVRTADAERPASPVYLAQASVVVISPPLEAERFSLIGRKAPPPVIPKAPAVIPAAAPQLVKVKRPLFGKPVIPKPRHGEEGAQEYLEALKHYHEGNSTEASESFGRFARKFSGSRLAPSAAYLSGDSHFEAEPSVDEFDLDLDDPGTSIGKLKRDRKKKRLRQAVTAYRWAVQAFPETEWTPWGLLQLGRSQSQLGFYFRAETTFQDLADRYPKHPLTAVGMAYQGFTNLKLGDSELALEIFQKALKHPRAGAHALALARYGLGGAYFQLKKIELAKAEFEKALKKAPTLANFSPDVLFLMGETFLASGEFSRARKFYAKQMEKFPDSENLPYVMTRVAESHLLEKDLARAIDGYAKVIGKHPRTESSIISLIRLADLAVEEPEFVTKKLKAKHPALRDPLKTYRRIGKEGKPRALAELAWSRLGDALMSRKRFGEAVEVFRRLVEDYADGRLYGRALFGLESALMMADILECPPEQREMLEFAGRLHDIGKVGIQDAIMLKPDRLSRNEMESMRRHPVIGEQIVRPVCLLTEERAVIRNHHEWWNGDGYPDRLTGEEIPLLARILSVADAFDAMTSDRPYRDAMSPQQALCNLEESAGVQFDKDVVDAFRATSAGKRAGMGAMYANGVPGA